MGSGGATTGVGGRMTPEQEEIFALAELHLQQICAWPGAQGAFVMVIAQSGESGTALSIPGDPESLRALARILRSEADRVEDDAASREGVQ